MYNSLSVEEVRGVKKMNQEQLDNNYKVYKEIMAKIKKTSKDYQTVDDNKYKKARELLLSYYYDKAEEELEDFVDTLTDEEADDIDKREGLTTIVS